MANICLGCLNPLPEGDERCRICGFSTADHNPAIALPLDTKLQEHYTVGRMVHEGSDSLLYLGFDNILKEPCFIQEFFAGGLCERAADGSVTPLGGCERPFGDYRKQFGDTARALARVKDLPCIIPTYDIFEENGTFYAVSDYSIGETLAQHLELAGGRIPWQEARPLFMSLMTCVEQLAGAGIHHLAICPANILITKDGKPHLRGFSLAAARQVGSDLTPRLATGFSAPEQYDAEGILGEATDVYGLAATIFRAVTGNTPPAGNTRAEDSDDLFMTAEIAEELTQQVCVALFNALLVSPEARTATVAALHQQLAMEPNVSALLDEDKPAEPTKKKTNTRALLIIFGSVAAALLVIALIVLFLLGDSQQPATSEPEASLPSFTTTTTASPTSTKYSVPSLLNQDYYDIYDKKTNGSFNIVIKHKEYSTKAAGIILSQEPEAGTLVDKGATIEVVVSLGKNDDIAIPDLAGWKEAHAKQYLEDIGFKVEVAQLFATDVPYGEVESTDPPAGTVKKRGDTITLRVSYVEPTTTTTDATDGSTTAQTEPTEPQEGDNTVNVDDLFGE